MRKKEINQQKPVKKLRKTGISIVSPIAALQYKNQYVILHAISRMFQYTFQNKTYMYFRLQVRQTTDVYHAIRRHIRR